MSPSALNNKEISRLVKTQKILNQILEGKNKKPKNTSSSKILKFSAKVDPYMMSDTLRQHHKAIDTITTIEKATE